MSPKNKKKTRNLSSARKPKISTKKGLTNLNWNVNGYDAREAQVQNLVELHEVDTVTLQETHLTLKDKARVKGDFPNFQVEISPAETYYLDDEGKKVSKECYEKDKKAFKKVIKHGLLTMISNRITMDPNTDQLSTPNHPDLWPVYN